MNTTYRETTRLIIRSFTADDIKKYSDIVSDPEVMRYLGDGQAQTYNQAEDYILDTIEQEKKTGYARYAVLIKNTRELIGFCGYKLYLNNIDLGWRYAREHWNMGYGTEAALAVLDIGIQELKFNKIVCIAHPDNLGALKIMQKIGLHFIGEWQLPNKKMVIRYELNRQ